MNSFNPSIKQKNQNVNKNGHNATTMQLIKVHQLCEKQVPAFNSKVRSIKIEILSLPQNQNFELNLKSYMKDIFDDLIDKCNKTDLISFKIETNNSLEFETPNIAFEPIAKVNHTLLENLIQNIIQGRTFYVGDSFDIYATCIIAKNSKCNRCNSSSVCTGVLNEIRCPDCFFDFYGKQCFKNHIKNSICTKIKRCPTCKESFRVGLKHSCKCKVCNNMYSDFHRCYMPPPYKFDKKSAFLFYDFETTQEKVFGTSKKLHEVNLCVAQLVCDNCFESELDEKCDICGRGKTYVYRKDPVRKLWNLIWNLQLPGRFDRLTCIAHNSKNYDAQFILKYLVEHTSVEPFHIVNGTSIIYMNFKNTQNLDIIFIDSISYFDMKLAKLPETFGFESTYKKGDFPHLFNTTENQEYVGPVPDQSYYDLGNMTDEELSDFQVWWKKLRDENYIFYFKKEIVHYCLTDVNILRKSCNAFRKLFIKIGGIDPFTEGASIATICSKIFRTKFLDRDSIGIIPTGGYRVNKRSSTIEWLLINEKKIGKELVHIGRRSEYRIDENIIVDGYIYKEDGSKCVYQFYECYWHGCPECFDSKRDKKIKPFGDSYNERYKKTMSAKEIIEKQGYELTEIWECNFKERRKRYQQYLLNHPLLMSDALNPRDAFYGGRIETYVKHREVKGDEKIHYIDICSLYPYINKYGKVPVRHPKVYFGHDCRSLTGIDNDLSKVEGLVKCRILPPRNLYHPVLPVRINDRTMFALCRLCCENSEKSNCHHEEMKDREFTGTWVSDELKKAVELGYRITRIYEIWQYEVEQYNPLTKDGGVFTKYVDMFLKIKQSASGWPSDCMTSKARKLYIDEFERREGIRLNPKNMVKNPGMRFISKKALNSLWGKFGQRDYGTSEILRNPDKLRAIYNSSEKKLVDIEFIKDKAAYCKWMHKDEYVKLSPDKNVAIAAYTTAQARLKLYEYLERLGDRVLYCNTDSCIYVSSKEKGQKEIKTGNFLGDMTDELAEKYGNGSYVREFVSCGSNFYSMIVVKPDGTEDIFRKGVTINSSNKNIFSHENIKALALGEKEILSHSYKAICRTKHHDVLTSEQKISKKTSFLKRRYPSINDSYPFGYKKQKID